ncbi:MAG: hypothetical protein EA419_00985 [Wenzhouxiangella sp.]|nr:MAG: hypothetical protein EA419_00985 [Wenzhouxiangella sp.]
MTESNREHLSCLMDGELDKGAGKFLVRRLSSDEQLSGRWRRYHLIRACMHNELAGGIDLGSRVADALAAEQALTPKAASGSRWFKPLGGAAIAASVAVAALVAINTSLMEREQPELLASEAGFVSQPSPLDHAFAQPLVPVSFSETSAADRQRIRSYVVRHNQAAGGAGFVSYVPIVAGDRSPPGDGAAAAPEPAAAGSGGY